MSATFPDGLPAILPATVAQIQRRLPAPGELKVRVGSRVEPDDLIGQCSVERPPLLLDIAGALQIEPRQLANCVRPTVGSRVVFRDILAKQRWGSRAVLAPFNGTLNHIDTTTGFVTLTPDPEPASVSAALRGYVAAIEPLRSATIETAAAVIQGMIGCGGEQWGLLRLLVTDPGDIITDTMIDARSAYTIVIGGAGITAEALRKAQAEQVKGIIVGSIDAAELRAYLGPQWHGNWQADLSSNGLPSASAEAPTLMVTEGFGTHPMSQPTFDLLTRFDRQEALLQGHTRLSPPEQRPRLLIPLQRLTTTETPPPPKMEVGAVVKIAAEAQCGVVGKVIAVNDLGRLPSGVRTATATVQTSADERSVLPQSLLYVIE